jgi:hypothetical protein
MVVDVSDRPSIKQEIREWYRFIQAESHILSENPALFFEELFHISRLERVVEDPEECRWRWD